MACYEEIQSRADEEHEILVEQAKSNIVPFFVDEKTRMNGRSLIVARANIFKHLGENFGRECIGHWMEKVGDEIVVLKRRSYCLS